MDLLIQNGTIVDGTGAAPFAGDIAIEAGLITAVAAAGQLDSTNARQVIDASGYFTKMTQA